MCGSNLSKLQHARHGILFIDILVEKMVAYLEVTGCEQLAGLGVQRGVGIYFEIKLEEAAKPLQDASRQVSIIALLKELLQSQQNNFPGLSCMCFNPHMQTGEHSEAPMKISKCANGSHMHSCEGCRLVVHAFQLPSTAIHKMLH